MTPQDQARLLLDRARRVMSGKEIEICEAVASGENPITSIESIPSDDGVKPGYIYRSNEWERITTEFAQYLKP